MEGFRHLQRAKSWLPMTATGVQRRASSSVGRADIDGIRSSYSNFDRTDTRLSRKWDRCAVRLMAQTLFDVMRIANEEVLWSQWVPYIFRSSAAPSPVYGTNEGAYVNGSHRKEAYVLQPKFLKAEQLHRSLLHAYASYAVQTHVQRWPSLYHAQWLHTHTYQSQRHGILI